MAIIINALRKELTVQENTPDGITNITYHAIRDQSNYQIQAKPII